MSERNLRSPLARAHLVSSAKCTALAAACVLALACSGLQRGQATPSPSLLPAEVVRIQVEALRSLEGTEGIAQAFRFASPANKQITGPLERFIRIVRAPQYVSMLKHRRASFSEIYVDGNYAAQIVTIVASDGIEHVYLFELSRQTEGEFAGCWMTDGVSNLAPNDLEARAASDAVEV